MTTRWVNNNRDGGNRYVQLPNKTSITVTNGSQMIGYEVSLRMGQRIQMTTPGPHETFRIINTTGVYVLDRNWPGMTGATLTGWAPSEYDGQTEAHALISINEALSYASGDDRVNVKWSAEGYVLSRQDQIAETLDVPGSGSVVLNKQLIIEGYKESVGDMRWDGQYHQDACDAFVNGVDANKKVKIDGDGITNILSLDGIENVVFRNFRFTNCTGKAIVAANSPASITFENCVFDDILSVCWLVVPTATQGDYFTFIDCYAYDQDPAEANMFVLEGVGHRVSNCVIAITGTTTRGVFMGWDSVGVQQLDNSLIIGGSDGVILRGGQLNMFNNTLYNQLTSVNVGDSLSSSAVLNAWNNIIMPSAHDTGLGFHINNDGGGTINSDFNCIWSADGQAMDAGRAFSTVKTGGKAPVIGANSIEVYPMLTSDHRPRNVDVLRGGKCDIHGNAGQIGAVLSEHQFKSNSSVSNQGRMRIFKN